MGLKHSKIELETLLKSQKKDADWTFYNEREFLENLLQTRFNFLIAVYAIFFAAFFTAKVDDRIIILFIGFFVTLLVSKTVFRIYFKVDILLKILYELGDNYTSSIIKKEMSEVDDNSESVNLLIGICIPLFLTTTFLIGMFYYFLQNCFFYCPLNKCDIQYIATFIFFVIVLSAYIIYICNIIKTKCKYNSNTNATGKAKEGNNSVTITEK
jgi:hypothetical protein